MVHVWSLWSKRPPTYCHNSRASPAPASFTIIDFPDHSEGHCPCSYFVFHTTPQLQAPEASVSNTTEGSARPERRRIDMLFQTRVNAIHHVRSERISAFTHIKWLGSCTECSSENMWRRKLLPAGMPSSVPQQVDQVPPFAEHLNCLQLQLLVKFLEFVI